MNIDLTKLKRNYKENPLKYGEIPFKDDLEYLFIECNLSYPNISKIIGRNSELIRKWCNKYNLKKDINVIRKSAQQTLKEKTGFENAMQNPKIIEKRKTNCVEKTGFEHPMQNPKNRCNFRDNNPMLNKQFIEQLKQNNLDKYGTEWFMGTDEFKEKSKQTCLDKYGVENPMQYDEYKLKMLSTCLEKYGTEHIAELEEIKSKIEQTCLDKYGANNPQKNKEIHEKSLQTRVEKYGDTKMYGTKSFKDTVVKTFIEKYGFPTPSKSPIIKEKTRQNNLKKYGTEWATPKINETKHKNKSWNQSNIEKHLYSLLLKKFPNTKSPYDEHPIYTFACDFYIPELDLLIEYNGTWTHGKEPFNKNKKEHVELLKSMEEKAISSKYYKNAIYTWTDLDVRKQTIAKENNLNYLYFYTEESFMEWYNKLCI